MLSVSLTGGQQVQRPTSPREERKKERQKERRVFIEQQGEPRSERWHRGDGAPSPAVTER